MLRVKDRSLGRKAYGKVSGTEQKKDIDTENIVNKGR